MATKDKQLRIGLFLYPTGRHAAGWRHPDAEVAAESFDLMKRVAQTAERGLFDLLFLADTLSMRSDGHPSVITRLEPLTLLGALAAVTKHIGLVGTSSTTYGAPYHIARQFLSLDHLSGGRAGWNIVTTGNADAARNFGEAAHPEHATRYEIADEFVTVVRGLWDSFGKDALVKDKTSGRYYDPGHVHAIEHKGPHYSVAGPVNMPRSPQGYPILVQAGSSEDGRNFAARHAEIVYTAQTTLTEASEFYADIKARVARAGRHPDHLLVMPGIMPVLGGTEAEARTKLRDLDDGLDATDAIAALSLALERDLSGFGLDDLVPAFDDKPVSGMRSRSQLLIDHALREKLTFRRLFQAVLGARGHWILAGTPEQVADAMEHWFRSKAADGFNVAPSYFIKPLEDFVDEVIPILQRRGLFKSGYAGSTLRECLSLPEPTNQFELAPAAPKTIQSWR